MGDSTVLIPLPHHPAIDVERANTFEPFSSHAATNSEIDDTSHFTEIALNEQ
jgi:hypothetical protein